MKVREFVQVGVSRLEAAGVYNPAADMERIIMAVFDGTAASGNTALSNAQLTRAEHLLRQRTCRMPFARISGSTVFCDLPIKVREGVFQPYPETEALLPPVFRYFADRAPPTRILDLGTGTGCLLLSLLQAFPDAQGLGVDCDQQAIELAFENAVASGLAERASLQLGDWTSGVTGTFDLIVSNPPRVPSAKILQLLPEMRDHDPRHSYDGGADGLAFFRRTAGDFARISKPGSLGVFQTSDASAVKDLFVQMGHSKTNIELNYLGIPCGISVMRS